MMFFGWRLVPNWGYYGSYGWQWGIFRSGTSWPGYRERHITIRFGPWAAMLEKVETNARA